MPIRCAAVDPFESNVIGFHDSHVDNRGCINDAMGNADFLPSTYRTPRVLKLILAPSASSALTWLRQPCRRQCTSTPMARCWCGPAAWRWAKACTPRSSRHGTAPLFSQCCSQFSQWGTLLLQHSLPQSLSISVIVSRSRSLCHVVSFDACCRVYPGSPASRVLHCPACHRVLCSDPVAAMRSLCVKPFHDESDLCPGCGHGAWQGPGQRPAATGAHPHRGYRQRHASQCRSHVVVHWL